MTTKQIEILDNTQILIDTDVIRKLNLYMVKDLWHSCTIFNQEQMN